MFDKCILIIFYVSFETSQTPFRRNCMSGSLLPVCFYRIYRQHARLPRLWTLRICIWLRKCCFANHRILVPSDDEIISMPCNGAQSAEINWHVTPSRRFVAFATKGRTVHEQLPLTLIEISQRPRFRLQGCVSFCRFIKMSQFKNIYNIKEEGFVSVPDFVPCAKKQPRLALFILHHVHLYGVTGLPK